MAFFCAPRFGGVEVVDMGLYDFTVYDAIQRNAISFGDKLAWFEAEDGRMITFFQFKEKVDRLAYGLQQAGITKGDRIGVLGKNSLEYFLLYGAAAAVGAIMLPINWRLSADEVSYNLADGEPVAVFADREYQELIKGFQDRLPSVQHYFNLERAGQGFVKFESLMDNAGDVAPADVCNDDGFVIIHTAAVAGNPRGAVLSHGNLLCANLHLNHYLNLTCEDVHLNLLPMFHMGGLMMAFSGFHAGALNVNMSRFDAEKAVHLIEEKNVSIMFDFSPILGSILEQQEKSGKTIHSLKAVIGLETPDTIAKYQQVTGGTFYCLYGQTETSGLATLGRYNDRPGSAGKMILLGQVRLVDDYDRPIAPGQTGEITLKGPMVFKGYWNLPEDNAHTFRGGWHHTGDLGRFDEQGFLWYAGRKPEKELIKPGGENVYPAEVEKVILQHPAIEQTVVFGVPDPRWKEGIKAVCRLKSGQNLNARELIDFVGQRIARYKKPQYVQFVTDFPLLEDGTPDRARIKDLYGGEQ
ncbi:MAG: AMP-binding protein [Pseudomonadota bacterium]|uniref:AMP-binding protein n=1 Tax=Candidatus Desulfatibia profunda TaxID=2841695 RepID=A0A8J6NTZ2_9BACT|nr:AMP-binding protein [Candidatus Desulfatibia profunda]MBL7178667.1 AMP-binding protein [Desulfobacterales bacterium]MBU0698472.1 AMP-binding protein [Pseudomonadota bacterium]